MQNKKFLFANVIIVIMLSVYILYTQHVFDFEFYLPEESINKTLNQLNILYKSNHDWIIETQKISQMNKIDMLNPEYLKLKELLINKFIDKGIKIHLYPLINLQWSEIFLSPTLVGPFEVTLIEKSYFLSGFLPVYTDSGGYFSQNIPNQSVSGHFANGKEPHMRLFIFYHLIDPFGTKMHALQSLNMSFVQYEYLVNSESFVKASELFLKNNKEVVEKARQFYFENNQINLGFLGVCHFQGFFGLIEPSEFPLSKNS